jgi:D-3-phosphoglycerate dehydrogenase
MIDRIGGSTEEAQSSIGQEVSQALIKFINTGSSLAAVNFPEIDLRVSGKSNIVRIINVHQNVPGVLKVINDPTHFYVASQQNLGRL